MDPIAQTPTEPRDYAALNLAYAGEPFVDEGPAGERRPRGRRLRYAVGELLSCTRCVGAWSALGVVGLRTLSPRAGRVVSAVLAASAINDVLHAGFRLLCERANVASGETRRTRRVADQRAG